MVSDKWRENTKKRLILETRDIEDAIELQDPSFARHVIFDSRYNWKCWDCSHKIECDELLEDEINLHMSERR